MMKLYDNPAKLHIYFYFFNSICHFFALIVLFLAFQPFRSGQERVFIAASSAST